MIEIKEIEKKISIKMQSGSIVKDLFYPEHIEKHVLKNINLTIDRGEKVGLIGCNGSGKSTLMKLMSGVVKATSGSIRVNGLDPHRRRRRLMKDTGVVFAQKSYLYPNVTLNDCIRLYSAVRKLDKIQAKSNFDRLNDFLNISKFKNQQVRTLSFGQRMRGEIFCALIHDPSLILLDEPNVGLDAESRSFLNEFLRANTILDGKTVITISHDPEIITSFCNRCIQLNEGEITYDGRSDILRKNIVVQYELKVMNHTVDLSGLPSDLVTVDYVSPDVLRMIFTEGTDELNIQRVVSNIVKLTSVQNIERRETINIIGPRGTRNDA